MWTNHTLPAQAGRLADRRRNGGADRTCPSRGHLAVGTYLPMATQEGSRGRPSGYRAVGAIGLCFEVFTLNGPKGPEGEALPYILFFFLLTFMPGFMAV